MCRAFEAGQAIFREGVSLSVNANAPSPFTWWRSAITMKELFP